MNTCYFYKFIKPKANNYLFVAFNGLYDIKNDTYDTLDFRKLFLSLDNNSKTLLEDIYTFSNECITTSTFISYIIGHNISLPIMQESYIINKNKDKPDFSFDYYNSKVILDNCFNDDLTTMNRKKITNSKEQTIKTIINNLFPYMNENKDYIISVKKLSFDNSQDFLIAFLNWILSIDHKLKIKKCKSCKSYFVASNGNNIYCSNIRQIDNENLTCNEFSAYFKSRRKFKNFKTLDKSFCQKINYRSIDEEDKFDYETYLENYKIERNSTIEKAVELNDFSLLKNFSLNYEKEHPLPIKRKKV